MGSSWRQSPLPSRTFEQDSTTHIKQELSFHSQVQLNAHTHARLIHSNTYANMYGGQNPHEKCLEVTKSEIALLIPKNFCLPFSKSFTDKPGLRSFGHLCVFFLLFIFKCSLLSSANNLQDKEGLRVTCSLTVLCLCPTASKQMTRT